MYNRKEIYRTRDPKNVGTIRENDTRLRSNKSEHFKGFNSHKERSPCSHNHKEETKCCQNSQESSASMLQLLLDENSNLKQQNYFLQEQLNQMISKQKQMLQTINEYESILSIMNSKNYDLHKDIMSFTDKTNFRVNRIKNSINEIIDDRKPHVYRSTAPLENYEDELPYRKNSLTKENFKSFKRVSTEKPRLFGGNLANEIRGYSEFKGIPSENLEFERLLEECQNESDPGLKKYLRRKLVDLTYQKAAVVGYLS